MAPSTKKQDVALSEEQIESLETIKHEQHRAELALELRSQARHHKLYEKRRTILKNIPKFWPTALNNHAEIQQLAQHRDDIVALSHLTDVWVERNPKEPRAYSIEFHFSENPYFTDTILKKEFKYDPAPRLDGPPSTEPGEDGISEAMLEFDPAIDIKPLATKINWKSDAKNLTKLHPRQVDAENEEDILEPGSIFNFFELEADLTEIGSIIANDVYEHAIDYFLGKGPNNREVNDDDEELSEEEVGDVEGEIDLERPKKKAKKAA